MQSVKNNFPIFKRKINGKDLVYLDSAATSQKPEIVIASVKEFYENHNANINRGVHTLSNEATEIYENTRKKVSSFINSSPNEIVFTKNATEGINLVANSFVKPMLKSGDIILLTEMEHHANLVPWQIIAKEKNAILKFIPVSEDGILDLKEAEKLLNQNPKFLAFTHISNFLGTINPVKELIEIAHKNNVKVLVDGAQSVPHIKTNIRDLNCDFLVFSAHKMLGPTGVGILYGKKELLEKMKPIFGGGDMIKEVSYNNFIEKEAPYKFESGTPNIADIAAFSNAIEYLENIGMENIQKHEKEITKYAYSKLKEIKNIKIYGPDIKKRASIIAFNYFDNSGRLIHAHDISSILDEEGIAVRAGHHCVMPLHNKLKISASARISFYIYTEKEDIAKFLKAMEKVNKIFNKK